MYQCFGVVWYGYDFVCLRMNALQMSVLLRRLQERHEFLAMAAFMQLARQSETYNYTTASK